MVVSYAWLFVLSANALKVLSANFGQSQSHFVTVFSNRYYFQSEVLYMNAAFDASWAEMPLHCDVSHAAMRFVSHWFGDLPATRF
jgi:hypothetical protein